MEKLKAALDKARAAREQAAGTAGAQRVVADVAVQDGSTKDAWDAIEVLGTQPRAAARRRLPILSGGPDATPFDVLRTKVLQLTGSNGWRRIAITSPLPGCGKTTMAANLALALARHGDMRIILFDLDMRRPGLAKLLDAPDGPSLSEVLEGQVDFSAQARRIGENLVVSMNHLTLRDSADLLLRKSTRATFDDIERRYQPDLILFDLPPMLVGDETQAFATCIDCAILVAEGSVSTIPQIDLCEKDLAEQTNVLGVVLNKCRFASEGSQYYYDYS